MFRNSNKTKINSTSFYFILPFFFLDEKETKNQGSEFLFVRKSLSYNYLQLVANNFNSFLKLKFFKNVLTEILKINSFSSVAKN